MFRDYCIEFWISRFNRRPHYVNKWHYQPKSFSLRADNGRWLILRAITKTLCYNLFITYSNSLFFFAIDIQ